MSNPTDALLAERVEKAHFTLERWTEDEVAHCADALGLPALLEALAFYADPQSWEEQAPPGGGFDGAVPAHEDNGERARAALDGERPAATTEGEPDGV